MTPNQSKTSCDQELLSELIDSLIDQQTCYDRELLSELIVTPYQSSLSPWEDNTRFAIGSHEGTQIVCTVSTYQAP